MTTLSRRLLLGSVAAGTAAVALPRAASALIGDSTPTRDRIDLHAHAIPPEYRESLVENGFGTIGGYPLPQWSPERAIDFMDRYGIQTQVLSLSDPGVSYLSGAEARDMARYNNTYMAGLFRQYPKRFGGLAVLPMPDVAGSVAEIEYALDVLKLDGVVLLSAYEGVYLGHPVFEPVMAALARRNAFVFLHPAAIPADNKPELPVPDFLYEFTFDTTRAVAQMIYGGTIARYPSIRFQLAHAGGTVPFLSYRLGLPEEVAFPGFETPTGIPAQIRGFYYDTALSPSRAAMASVLEVTGLNHIVFGSDWPFSELLFTGSGDPQPQLSETFDPTQRRQIERGNALRELPRLAARLS
ncbi:putative TIM-barrel fold metal-dependent hydrolase [Kribbella sp. VKM Ac-2527]|uniref:Putative TIM-barrel fold metal-dependent hydrolase n=1 Tax=Kribbella caucasensis TaxID=2512215 RepID=A0A4R6J583_9ACTN|nr:amidohydrolase family protein [Kribbella sp. VKM Ac-2527]TDO30177.1 putative TIM-barrel fold metal-dependent hydrolase [Kribbella sp. VKM Ac-2527]